MNRYPSQIQANLGEGHVNVINAYEAVLTETHLALIMEYAACGSLTSYVANRWQHAQHSGLFLSEDEARYFFRVRRRVQQTRVEANLSFLCTCNHGGQTNLLRLLYRWASYVG